MRISAGFVAASEAASIVDNAWTSLPPGEQQAIEVTAAVAVAAVAVVATAGLATPAVAAGLADAGVIGSLGAALSAGADTVAGTAAIGAATNTGIALGVGLAQGDASPQNELEAAAVGAVGGGLSSFMASGSVAPLAGGLTKFVAGQAAAGVATNLVSQAISSGVEHKPAGSAIAVVGLGAAFGVGGGRVGEALHGALGAGIRSAFLGAGATGLAQTVVQNHYGIQYIGRNRWF